MSLTHTRSPRHALRILVVAAGACAALALFATPAFADYDPTNAISNDNMRAYDSMNEAQIQSFLDSNKGPLKSLVTTDYAGVPNKKASKIIYDASRGWKINPKVLLVTLQKEQSLIETAVTPRALEYRLKAAMGAGVYDKDGDGDVDHQYPGFGNQVWNAARLLDKYGESYDTSSTRRAWATAGITIYDYTLKKKVKIYPKNVATFKLYTYTPYSTGPKTTATLYTRYFGSPFANPRYRAIYRFKKLSTGSYLYTASASERYKLGLSPKSWRYEGSAFSTDSSATTTSTVPVYRFYNYKTGKYSFTSSASLKKSRTTTTGKKTWKYSGTAFRVGTGSTAGAVKVYRFRSKKSGHVFLTKSTTTVTEFRTKAKAKIWRYEGVAYYLPRVQ